MRVVEMPGLQGVGGQRGLACSVRSCRGRKDDVRQENHGTDHTESRKPVNLGNNTLCMAHPCGVQDASQHDTLVVCKMLEGGRRRYGQQSYIHAAKLHCHVGGVPPHHSISPY